MAVSDEELRRLEEIADEVESNPAHALQALDEVLEILGGDELSEDDRRRNRRVAEDVAGDIVRLIGKDGPEAAVRKHRQFVDEALNRLRRPPDKGTA